MNFVVKTQQRLIVPKAYIALYIAFESVCAYYLTMGLYSIRSK